MSDWLDRRATHRQTWLTEAVATLSRDDRVHAVWLVGSLGSGSHDEWSDIDVVIVLTDDTAPAFIADRVKELGRFGEILCRWDAPQNAPDGGYHMCTIYGFEGLPFWVDVHMWARSTSARPSDAAPLFEREPCASRPQAFSDITGPALALGRRFVFTEEQLQNARVSTLLAAAKAVARGGIEEVRGLVAMMWGRDIPSVPSDAPAFLMELRRLLQREFAEPATHRAVAGFIDVVEGATCAST